MTRVLEINGLQWETPLSSLPEVRVRKARIRHDTLPRGYYPLERAHLDADFYRVTHGRLPVTYLERKDADENGWATWGLDDPMNWFGTMDAVRRLPAGRVVMAGMGLGLMIHHLTLRPDITRAEIVELDADVVELVNPLLPRDPRVSVVVSDFYRYATYVPPPDGVLWDVHTGSTASAIAAFAEACELVGQHWPGVPMIRVGR